jgi:hypothetical protein
MCVQWTIYHSNHLMLLCWGCKTHPSPLFAYSTVSTANGAHLSVAAVPSAGAVMVVPKRLPKLSAAAAAAVEANKVVQLAIAGHSWPGKAPVLVLPQQLPKQCCKAVPGTG